MTCEWAHQLAPAKLTLSLRVTGVRADGFHTLDAEMVSLDLADELWFGPGDGLWVLAPEGARVSGVPSDETNLVCRALREVGRQASVMLLKRIPPGGLGGGSSGAAAVLRWAWGATHRPGTECPRRAASLGSDVPFCLVGGRARVRGAGEEVEPLPFASQGFTLVLPPFGVATARVYAQWDALGGPSASGPNDLEAAALAVEPRLAAWRDALGDLTGLEPVLAGSGSTWFVTGPPSEPPNGPGAGLAGPGTAGVPGTAVELIVGAEAGAVIAARSVAPCQD